MNARSSPADDVRRTANQADSADTPRPAPRPEADEAARRVVIAHYAWVARAARRQARIAERSALAEIGGEDHAPETVGAQPAPGPCNVAPEPVPSLWPVAFARRVQKVAGMIRARLFRAISTPPDFPVSPEAHLRDSPVVRSSAVGYAERRQTTSSLTSRSSG